MAGGTNDEERMVQHHYLSTLLCVALLCSGCADDDPVDDDTSLDDDDSADLIALPAGVTVVSGLDPLHDSEDLSPIAGMIGSASLVGIGESVQLSNSYAAAHHRIIRYLVEEQGFRVLGVESSRAMAKSVGDYVDSCSGDPAELVQTNLHVIYRSPEFVSLLEWLCEYNQLHSDDKVRFYGFDIIGQAPFDAPRLVEFLELVMDEEPLNDLQPGIDLCPLVTQPAHNAEFNSCIDALDAVDEYLQINEDAIVAATSEHDLQWAWIHSIGLRGSAGYQFLEQQPGDMPIAWAARDRALAAIITRLRPLVFDDAKMVLWAHNAHVAKETEHLRTIIPSESQDILWGVKSMGQRLLEISGDYAAIGMTSHRLYDDVSEFPLPDSPEGLDQPYLADLLNEYGHDTLLLDTHGIGVDALLEDGEEVLLRVRNGYTDHDTLQVSAPKAIYDGLLYVEGAQCNRDVSPRQTPGIPVDPNRG